MSLSTDTAARYDRISEVYDETREPLTSEALDRVSAILTGDGNKRILEAGVGTGRIALPLQQRNFEVVGVDLSKGMLTKAREKGVKSLILADANRLPFKRKQFDAALLVHVLHLLENPVQTFESLRQAAANEIVIFVRKRDRASSDDDGRALLRETFRRVAAELGYGLPERSGGRWGGFARENEFLSSFPPTVLAKIEDKLVITTVRERLSFFEKRAYGHLSDIPDDVFRKIMRGVTASLDVDREIRYRRIEQMAIWRLPR